MPCIERQHLARHALPKRPRRLAMEILRQPDGMEQRAQNQLTLLHH
jgi:hypothetical protein